MRKWLAGILGVVFLLAGASAQAACTPGMSNSARGNWISGLFLKADTYKIAFYTDSATYSASTAQYSATNEVNGSGYSAGGWALDTLTYGTSGSTAWMDWADEVNNTVTFSAASTCAVIYDDTAANTSCTGTGAPWTCCSGSGAGTCQDAVLGVFTFTSIQPTAGTVTVTFPTADASNAIFRIGRSLWDFITPTVAYAADVPYRRDAFVALDGFQINLQ